MSWEDLTKVTLLPAVVFSKESRCLVDMVVNLSIPKNPIKQNLKFIRNLKDKRFTYFGPEEHQIPPK